MAPLTRLSVFALLAFVPFARAAEFGKEPTGHSLVTFADRSPLSTNQEICARMGWPLLEEEAAKGDYKLTDESFELYVPSTYTGEKPFGLFVFVNPGGNGSLKGYERLGWKEIIDKHELIWIGPNKVGNDRLVRPRMGLTIDAAINIQTRYKIDPKRVYVAGVSGGGRVASMLGVGFSDVFKGGFYIIGCNFYRQEKSIEQDGIYKRSYFVPPTRYYVMAKKDCKHVFLTGDTDPNRDQTRVYYNAFKRDGFEHITYFQVPGMGHAPPPQDWFAKGIDALDAEVTAPPAATALAPRAAAVKPAPAPPATQRTPADDAQKLLAQANLFISNKLYDLAREKLRYIIVKFPDTPAAAQAERQLEELRDK
jgi:Esterase PHB depolymerase